MSHLVCAPCHGAEDIPHRCTWLCDGRQPVMVNDDTAPPLPAPLVRIQLRRVRWLGRQDEAASCVTGHGLHRCPCRRPGAVMDHQESCPWSIRQQGRPAGRQRRPPQLGTDLGAGPPRERGHRSIALHLRLIIPPGPLRHCVDHAPRRRLDNDPRPLRRRRRRHPRACSRGRPRSRPDALPPRVSITCRPHVVVHTLACSPDSRGQRRTASCTGARCSAASHDGLPVLGSRASPDTPALFTACTQRRRVSSARYTHGALSGPLFPARTSTLP